MSSDVDQLEDAIHKLSMEDLKPDDTDSNTQPSPLQNPEPAPPCFLLDLPPELRSRIWEYTISLLPTQVANNANAEVPRRIKVKSGSLDALECCRPPAIAQTNRALRAETLPIFYGANKWEVHSRAFLESIRPHLNLFKHIVIGECWRFKISGSLPVVQVHLGRIASYEALGFTEGVLRASIRAQWEW